MNKSILSAGLITVGLLLAIIVAFVQSTNQNPVSTVVATPVSALASEGAGGDPACLPDAGDCDDFGGNGTPGCEDDACCNLVCAVDSFCCETAWDAICADYARDNCINGNSCDQAIVIGDGAYPVDLTDNTDSGVAISCGTPGVDEWYEYTAWTCATIAEICTEFTDVDITIAVFDACGGSEIACSGDHTDCFWGNPDSAWVTWTTVPGTTYLIRVSGDGATDTLNFISDLFVAGDSTCECGPGAGNCFLANGTPGCEDVACCETICAIDLFCCDVEWDDICAAAALSTCGDDACGTLAAEG